MDRSASNVQKWLYVERCDLADIRGRLQAIAGLAERTDLPTDAKLAAIAVLAYAGVRMIDDALVLAAA